MPGLHLGLQGLVSDHIPERIVRREHDFALVRPLSVALQGCSRDRALLLAARAEAHNVDLIVGLPR